MTRAFNFDIERVTEQLDRILQMELAGVIYYTHYSFMIYGHARILFPVTDHELSSTVPTVPLR